MGSSEGPMKVTSKYMKWLEEGGRDQCYALVELEKTKLRKLGIPTDLYFSIDLPSDIWEDSSGGMTTASELLGLAEDEIYVYVSWHTAGTELILKKLDMLAAEHE